jgi:chromate reductase
MFKVAVIVSSNRQAAEQRRPVQVGDCGRGGLFATPEHNRSIPGVMKNAIDWDGRPYGQNPWNDKAAALTGTSPGACGAAVAAATSAAGSWQLGHARHGGEAHVSFRPDLIDANGAVTHEGARKLLRSFVDQFAALVARFADPQPAAA